MSEAPPNPPSPSHSTTLLPADIFSSSVWDGFSYSRTMGAAGGTQETKVWEEFPARTTVLEMEDKKKQLLFKLQREDQVKREKYVKMLRFLFIFF